MEEYHYETEHERKEDSLRLRLSQPPQYGDTAEMADDLTVDPEAKRRMLGLARKVETEVDESWYEDFTTICAWRWTSTAV